jgi:enoyl-CoA hydratase/carnithine racemase
MTANDSPRKNNGSDASAVNVHDHGQGIFSIQIIETESANTLSPSLIRQLRQVLEALQHTASVKVLILKGTPASFLRGGREHYNEALSQQLYQAIASFPYPVIAAMQGAARGAGFLVGALCDFMVCSETATYHYTCPEDGLFPTAAEERLLSKRLGQVRAADFLYHATTVTGKQLREKSWTCPILPPEHIETYAHTLAANLAKKSQDSLRLLKQHLARELLALTTALSPVAPRLQERPQETATPGIKITPPSKHLQWETPADNVLLLRIRATKKTYDTNTLAAELSAVLRQVTNEAANPGARPRVMVLVSEYADFLPEAQGNVPASAVLELQRLLRQAPLPIIAVLNRAACGPAWLVSQFCDAVVYTHEGRYGAADLLQNPALATLAAMMFAYRFGTEAARELLLTGATYSGIELQQRVGPLPVVAPDQALSAAVTLAQSWAALPRETLVAWKKERTRSLEDAIEHVPAGVPADPENLKPCPSTSRPTRRHPLRLPQASSPPRRIPKGSWW